MKVQFVLIAVLAGSTVYLGITVFQLRRQVREIQNLLLHRPRTVRRTRMGPTAVHGRDWEHEDQIAQADVREIPIRYNIPSSR